MDLKSQLDNIDDYFKKKIRAQTGIAVTYAGFVDPFLSKLVEMIIGLVRETTLKRPRPPFNLAPCDSADVEILESTPHKIDR